MLNRVRNVSIPLPAPLRRHLWSHSAPLAAAVLAVCAAALAWWGDTVVTLPNLSGGAAIPVEASDCLPVAIAAVVLLSTSDALGGFSEHAARSRRRILAIHLAGAVTVASVLTCLSLLVGGAADQISPALRNLLMGTGLAALGAALLGVRSSWIVPLALATPALTVGNPARTSWWQWPTAPTDTFSWTLALLACATGITTLLLRTARYRNVLC
ncbi:hypothetical protein ACWGIB_18910 [Streptomyces xiamenensis]